jgi:predicted peptidase
MRLVINSSVTKVVRRGVIGVAMLLAFAGVGGCSGAAKSSESQPDGGRSADTAPANDAAGSGFLTWTRDGQPVGLYLPPSHDKPLPVAMYLHYCGGAPVSPELWIISALNAVEPCAVFVPTATKLDANCADWGGTYASELTQNMVRAMAGLDEVVAKYGFDSKRQYLYGESMGAEGVFKLLMDFPTRFAAAVAAGGYTLDKGASAMAQTPFWIFHGSDDSINLVASVRTIHQSILDAGGTSIRYTEYPGLDHMPAIEKARSEPGLFAWLFAGRRTSDLAQGRRRDISPGW